MKNICLLSEAVILDLTFGIPVKAVEVKKRYRKKWKIRM
jgi:hypothetical protein